MQRVFRKIRQKIVEGGGLRRYLVYAFGEIRSIAFGKLMDLFRSHENIQFT